MCIAFGCAEKEGGRHTPFFTNYSPQLFFRTADVASKIILPEGVQMVMPGDNTTVKLELFHDLVGCAAVLFGCVCCAVALIFSVFLLVVTVTVDVAVTVVVAVVATVAVVRR